MSSVARAVWLARLLTSCATTAKPRPASPARAASIVAFKREQVGLSGNVPDQPEDRFDRLGMIAERLRHDDRARRFVGRARGDPGRHLHLAARFLDRADQPGGGLRRLAHRYRRLLGRRRHFRRLAEHPPRRDRSRRRLVAQVRGFGHRAGDDADVISSRKRLALRAAHLALIVAAADQGPSRAADDLALVESKPLQPLRSPWHRLEQRRLIVPIAHRRQRIEHRPRMHGDSASGEAPGSARPARSRSFACAAIASNPVCIHRPGEFQPYRIQRALDQQSRVARMARHAGKHAASWRSL